jgi:signal transduction histidine kinase
MKIGAKITFLAVCPVIVALAVTLVTLLIQQSKLNQKVGETINEQAFSEAGKIAQSVYWVCVSTESRNQKRLAHNLGVARELLQQTGGISLSSPGRRSTSSPSRPRP